MIDLLDTIRGLVEPLAHGEYVADWQARAARLSALGDYYSLRMRDNPFLESEDAGLGGPFGSPAHLRSQMHAHFDEAMAARSVSYGFALGPLTGTDRELFARAYHQVDSVEKMAMSAIAHALYRLQPPLPVALQLCGVLYDEALHLTALSSLLAIPQEKEPWITPKREPFWHELRRTEDLLSYVFLQHCLSEAEGSIAAAEKWRQLQQAGAGPTATRVAHRIFVEETGHALTGYMVLKQLDESLPASVFHRLVERYLESEPLVEASTRKGQRQRFALRLAELYITRRSLTQVHAELMRCARAAALPLPLGEGGG
ncbi:hypothetical protein JQX13_15460 [Archangium violaceum]|uniref:DUF455 family protein n=1 Tax=Archangium violaceum TaxID=83451 RepID=UPI00193B6F77|nr:DUF455 family protein [Archangium violaceum]QRK11343.1 hypothetical protein JQX13_15460 [Archangium violaceum]